MVLYHLLLKSQMKKGNIFLNFGDVVCLEPPIKVQGALFIKEFSNPINLAGLKQVLVDEELDSFGSTLEEACKATPCNPEIFSRNPFTSCLLVLQKESQIQIPPDSKKHIPADN